MTLSGKQLLKITCGYINMSMISTLSGKQVFLALAHLKSESAMSMSTGFIHSFNINMHEIFAACG